MSLPHAQLGICKMLFDLHAAQITELQASLARGQHSQSRSASH